MPEDRRETHIHIHGVTGPVAAAGGDQTGDLTQNIGAPPSAELEELLDRLREEIDAHAGELTDPDGLRGAVDVVDEQIQSGRPNAGMIRTLLQGMTAGAGQITPLVETIARLEAALRSAF